MCKGFEVKRDRSFKKLKGVSVWLHQNGKHLSQVEWCSRLHFPKNGLRTSPSLIGLSRTLWLFIKCLPVFPPVEPGWAWDCSDLSSTASYEKIQLLPSSLSGPHPWNRAVRKPPGHMEKPHTSAFWLMAVDEVLAESHTCEWKAIKRHSAQPSSFQLRSKYHEAETSCSSCALCKHSTHR